jgi:murein DD-endopeptidase MepM/ murein hydrolase activator NlpD
VTGRRPGWPPLLPGLAVLLCTAALGPSPVGAGPRAISHEVTGRETLSGIAHRYGVSVREIVSANRLSGPRVRLQVGRRLAIPEGQDSRRGAATAPSIGRRGEGTPRVAGRRGQGSPRAIGRGGPRARRAALRTPSPRDFFALPPVNMLLAIPEFAGPVPEFSWPVDGAVSSSFGRRWLGWHRGVDIAAVQGAPIQAAAAGVVVASGIEPRYGRVVKIEHDHGFLTVYAHNLANTVEVGQRVAAGQEIGNVGQTGRASGAHLHFEIRHEGRVVNPLYLLPLPPRVATEEFAVEPEDEDE